jgi:hypothetical protein
MKYVYGALLLISVISVIYSFAGPFTPNSKVVAFIGIANGAMIVYALLFLLGKLK